MLTNTTVSNSSIDFSQITNSSFENCTCTDLYSSNLLTLAPKSIITCGNLAFTAEEIFQKLQLLDKIISQDYPEFII